MSSDRLPEPVRPVDPHDATLPVLRRETRLQGRSERWAAISFALVAVGFVVLLRFVAPAQFAQAFGQANNYTAVVENVELSADQPSPGIVRRNGPKWDVQVTWNDHGTIRRGTSTALGNDQPYQAGQDVDITTADDGNAISLQTGDGASMLGLLIGFPALCAIPAGFYWHRSRRWRPLSTLVTRSQPWRVQVTATPVPHRQRRSRFAVLEHGHLVDYQAVGDNDGAGSLFLLRANHLNVPAPNDEQCLKPVDEPDASVASAGCGGEDVPSR